MPLSDHAVEALRAGRVSDPFSLLGLHLEGDKLCARVWQRGAEQVTLIPAADEGLDPIKLRRRDEGLFEAVIPDRRQAFPYSLEVRRPWDDQAVRLRDPYSFWLQLSEWDLERFRAGEHHNIEDILGARPCSVDGCDGVLFAVWAPAAERVSVVGDWNDFDGRWHPMRLRHPFGVWELFIPDVAIGMRYKFEVMGRDGQLRVKADPYARACEVPSATASLITGNDAFAWTDADWLAHRDRGGWRQRPMAIYEVHVGSWLRAEHSAEPLNYRDLATPLIEHCRRFGYNFVEFLPLAAHPFEGSWGYQVSGQFAPNSRHGAPDDLRYLIDQLHQAEIGVIVDFVPGHFPKDDFALARFDGHPLYEYADPMEGEHKGWGTLVFNWRRPEVRNFLCGAALYWLRSFHIDGLRVDAVSSMLYRNYDRPDGEWIPNEHGGMENLEAARFLRQLNGQVHELFSGVVTIAEESTSWQGVTSDVEAGGLGFDLKWNMGWMHDTLRYLAQDPVMRKGDHDTITFHQWYAYDESWVLPLSHDEVVHGKGSLLDKMSGDYAQRLQQLKLLYVWQVAVPGRPLLFQGGEFAQGAEWSWESSVPWQEADEIERQGVQLVLAAALRCYHDELALHADDDQRDGFQWTCVENRQESIVAFIRRHQDEASVLAVFNFTPVPRPQYPIGVPVAGKWSVLLNADDSELGGQGDGPRVGSVLATGDESLSDWAGVLRVDLPAFAALLIKAT